MKTFLFRVTVWTFRDSWPITYLESTRAANVLDGASQIRDRSEYRNAWRVTIEEA